MPDVVWSHVFNLSRQAVPKLTGGLRASVVGALGQVFLRKYQSERTSRSRSRRPSIVERIKAPCGGPTQGSGEESDGGECEPAMLDCVLEKGRLNLCVKSLEIAEWDISERLTVRNSRKRARRMGMDAAMMVTLDSALPQIRRSTLSSVT